MKTAKEQLQQNWGFTDEDIEKLEKHLKELNYINLDDIITEMQFYAREAIKEDRDKVANYVVYQNTLHNKNGEIIDTKVKETIRNAPEIELL